RSHSTYSRVTRLRHRGVKSVLAMGRAGRATGSAACAITASLSGCPTIASAATDAWTGRDARAPRTIRTASTAPSGAILAAAATDNTGKSNEPLRRSFTYVLRHPTSG